MLGKDTLVTWFGVLMIMVTRMNVLMREEDGCRYSYRPW